MKKAFKFLSILLLAITLFSCNQSNIALLDQSIKVNFLTTNTLDDGSVEKIFSYSYEPSVLEDDIAVSVEWASDDSSSVDDDTFKVDKTVTDYVTASIDNSAKEVTITNVAGKQFDSQVIVELYSLSNNLVNAYITVDYDGGSINTTIQKTNVDNNIYDFDYVMSEGALFTNEVISAETYLEHINDGNIDLSEYNLTDWEEGKEVLTHTYYLLSSNNELLSYFNILGIWTIEDEGITFDLIVAQCSNYIAIAYGIHNNVSSNSYDVLLCYDLINDKNIDIVKDGLVIDGDKTSAKCGLYYSLLVYFALTGIYGCPVSVGVLSTSPEFVFSNFHKSETYIYAETTNLISDVISGSIGAKIIVDLNNSIESSNTYLKKDVVISAGTITEAQLAFFEPSFNYCGIYFV